MKAINTDSALKVCLFALPLLLVFLIYGGTRHFGFSLDDHLILESLPAADSGLKGFRDIFTGRYNLSEYRPVTVASFHLEQLAWGRIDTGRSHLINAGIYAANLYLIGLWLWLLTARYGAKRFWIIAGTVLLFCAHPMHANVVSSLKSRDALLSLFFLSGSLTALARLLTGNLSRWRSVMGLTLFTLFFALSFFSKRDTFGLLAVAPLTVLMFRPRTSWLAGASALCCLAVILFYGFLSGLLAPVTDMAGVQDAVRFTENPMPADAAPGDRIAAALSTVFLYAKFFFVPVNYLFYFGYDAIDFPFHGARLAGVAILTAGLLTVVAMAWRNNRLLAYAIVFTGLNLVYCLNALVPISGIVAPRYAYTASLGFCLGLAALLIYLKPVWLRSAVLLILVGSLAFLARERSGDWRNLETLMLADIEKLDRSHEANRMAAVAFMNKADTLPDHAAQVAALEKARTYIGRANAIYDGHSNTHRYEGMIAFKLGNLPASIAAFRRAAFSNGQINTLDAEILADSYYTAGEPSQARVLYKTLLGLQPERQELINKISTTYYDQGLTDSLHLFNDSLIAREPTLYAPYENYGYLYLNTGDTARAAPFFRKALDNGLEDPDIEALLETYP